MKSKLLVLIVAAACAIGNATASRAAAPPPLVATPVTVEVSTVDGGWWDWHQLYM